MGGAPYGWQTPELISPERGISTHVFASFDPVLKGMSSLNNLPLLPDSSLVPFSLANLVILFFSCQQGY